MKSDKLTTAEFLAELRRDGSRVRNNAPAATRSWLTARGATHAIAELRQNWINVMTAEQAAAAKAADVADCERALAKVKQTEER